MPKDYHKILGLEQNADISEIKKAFRELAKKYHPDVNKAQGTDEIFIEITEAYEVLIDQEERKIHRAEKEYTYEDLKRDFREEARQRAAEHARMKYEKFVREHEAFKTSGVYDISLVIKIFARIFLVFFTFAMFLTPIILSFYDVYLLLFGFFCWPLAVYQFFFIYERRKHYFMPDKFYYNFERIKKYFNEQVKEPDYKCFYCKGAMADSKPYKVYLLKIKDIKTVNNGPLQRQVSYKNIYKKIRIPRSRKALRIHTISSFLKLFLMIIVPFLLPFDCLVWKFIISFFITLFISIVFNVLSRTKSKVGYMLNLFFLVKITIWMVILILLTDFRYGFLNMQLKEMGRAVIGMMIFFDPVMELLIKLPGFVIMFRPLKHSYYEMDKYFQKKYQYYVDAPVWTLIYPFFKWIIG